MLVLRRNFLGLLLILFLARLSGAGTFKNPAFIDTAYDPIGVATSDLNHDGNTDLVYVDGIGAPALHVLLGRGDGTFSDAQDLALPAGSCGYLTCVINLADTNRDGITDIILGASGSKNQLAVLLGKGDGTFQPPIFSSVTNSNGQTPSLNALMGIGDINGDGAVDLIIPDYSSASLYILLGNNTGKFTLSSHVTEYFTGHVAAYLFDLNGDGKLDAVVNDEVGAQTYVLLGNGDGTFQTQTVYVSFAVSFADMDNDGHPDLVANVYPGQIEVLKGNADGTFSPPIVVTTVAASDFLLAVGDYNGDGILDLLFQNPGGVGVALGKGGLTYGPVSSTLAATTTAIFFAGGGVSTSDFNNDGKNDVAIGVDGGIAVLLGNGDGTFISGDLYDVGHPVGTIAIADFNGDKNPDIAVTVAAPYPRLLLGNGQGSFTLAADQNQNYMAQGQASMLFPGDFNGDGKEDLDTFQTNINYPWGQTFIVFGGVGGTFATPIGLNYGSSVVADFNNDGRSDLITFGTSGFTSLLGQSNGGFNTVTTPIKYDESEIAAVGDLNHDGKLDLIVDAYPTLETWLGKGDGTFTYKASFGASAYAASVVGSAIADLDGDGNPDYVVATDQNGYNTPQPLTIYYGNGDGTFQSPVSLAISHNYTLLTIADTNRDGKPDLILTDGSGIAVILNMGGRAFEQEQHYVGGAGITGIAVADVNGDGFPDIVAADGSSGTTVAVLLNQPNGSGFGGAQSVGVFTIAPEPANYGQPVTLTLTLSAPSGSGLPTPTGSVTFNVDGALITTVNLTNGKASSVYSVSLSPGTHTFVATYNGDQNYRPSSFSSLHVVQDPVYTTQTSLTASPSSLFTSQTVRLTATVTSPAPVQNGVVTFFDGSATLGARTVDVNGVALLDTALLSAGSHAIKAVYEGYQSFIGVLQVFTPSTSPTVTVTVSGTVTTTALSTSSNSPTLGTVVTFTANVSSSSGTPAGGVSFYDGTSILGTSSVQANGSASFSTASLSLGNHSITATYNASGPYASSTSTAQNVSVVGSGSSALPTAVALALNNDAAGSTLLTASLSDSTNVGTVTFLDGGTILGTAPIRTPGRATLSVPSLSAGAHTLTASFSGNPQLAPSVSPLLSEQWPAGGAGFTLSAGENSLVLTSSGSQPLTVQVVPDAGFQQVVSLSCPNGLPVGYSCVFTPNSLNTGGSSALRIAPAGIPIGYLRTSGMWCAFGCFGLCFLGRVRRRQMDFLVLMLLTGALSGCGSSATAPLPSQLRVLTIQATAGPSGANAVHSVQVILRISPTD